LQGVIRTVRFLAFASESHGMLRGGALPKGEENALFENTVGK
jgi:hypothetical protein